MSLKFLYVKKVEYTQNYILKIFGKNRYVTQLVNFALRVIEGFIKKEIR